MSKFKAKNKDEKRASGISPDIRDRYSPGGAFNWQQNAKPSERERNSWRIAVQGSENHGKNSKTGGEKQWSDSSREKQEKYRRCYGTLAKESSQRELKTGEIEMGKHEEARGSVQTPKWPPTPKWSPFFFALTLKWSPINLRNGKKQNGTARMRNIITALAMWSQSRLRVRKMILHYLKTITVKEKQRRKFVPSAEGSLSTYQLEFTTRTVA